MKLGQYQAADRLLLNQLAKAEANANRRVEAQCYWNLGNCAEAEHRGGEALRCWSKALFLLEREGCAETAAAARLRRLIRLYHEHNPQVFVWASYARAHKARVAHLVRYLRRAQITVIYDTGFVPGHSVHRQVLAAIQRCSKQLVVWSKTSRARPWVQYEVDVLRRLKRQRRKDIKNHALDNVVIFYCLDKTSPPPEFTDDLYIRAQRDGARAALKQLKEAITTSEVS